MTKEIFDGYKYIEGGVCAAKGFVANGLNCGINPVKEKFDLGVVYSETECNAAGVYTQNKVKGAPMLLKNTLKKVAVRQRLLSLIQKMQIPVMLTARRLLKKFQIFLQMPWESNRRK